jgi:ribosomal protein L22
MSDKPDDKSDETEATSPVEAPAVEPETTAVTDSSQGASSGDIAPASAAQVDDGSTTPAEGDELAEVVAEVSEPASVDLDEGAAEPASETAPSPSSAPARSRPAASAPRRRRSRREPGEEAPVVRAQAKYVRSSARKARLVCDHIRGKSVDEARAILAVTPRAIARDWSKLLESAVANAEHNHELVGEDLYVKAVHADEGPTIKRFRPRAMGRASPIRKRTSHLTILLTPKD